MKVRLIYGISFVLFSFVEIVFEHALKETMSRRVYYFMKLSSFHLLNFRIMTTIPVLNQLFIFYSSPYTSIVYCS